jgi:hypothetical protein
MPLLLETEVRSLLDTLRVSVPTTKDQVRAVLLNRKRDNLLNNRQKLKRLEGRALSLMRRVDYSNIKPRLAHVSPKDKPLWDYIRQCVSSTPYGGRVGRVSCLWCMDSVSGGIMGIVEICSDMMILPPRDRHIGWTQAHRSGGKLNHVANVGTCVCVQPFGTLCGGKFQIVAASSSFVSDLWEQRYGDRLVALCTTSLYGESSIYNRIKEWSYLGNTIGQGIFHLDNTGYKLLQRFLRSNKMTARTGGTNIDPTSRQDTINKVCNVLKIDRESISSHQPRGVYWCEVVPNASAFLRGETDTTTRNTRPQEAVCEWWLDRWYRMRLPKKEAEISAFDWTTYKVDNQIDLCVGSADSGTATDQVAGAGAHPSPTLF